MAEFGKVFCERYAELHPKLTFWCQARGPMSGKWLPIRGWLKQDVQCDTLEQAVSFLENWSRTQAYLGRHGPTVLARDVRIKITVNMG
jgi:hypothetical protein